MRVDVLMRGTPYGKKSLLALLSQLPCYVAIHVALDFFVAVVLAATAAGALVVVALSYVGPTYMLGGRLFDLSAAGDTLFGVALSAVVVAIVSLLLMLIGAAIASRMRPAWILQHVLVSLAAMALIGASWIAWLVPIVVVAAFLSVGSRSSFVSVDSTASATVTFLRLLLPTRQTVVLCLCGGSLLVVCGVLSLRLSRHEILEMERNVMQLQQRGESGSIGFMSFETRAVEPVARETPPSRVLK